MPSFSDRFDCSAAEFWTLFLKEEYQRRLHLEGMGFVSYRVLERGPESWRVHVVPSGLPGVVRKVLGDGGYIEEGRRDGEFWRFEITPDTLGDRIRTVGVLRIVDKAPGSVRSADIHVTARLMGVGRAVEKALDTMTLRQQEKATTFTHAVIASGMLSTEESA